MAQLLRALNNVGIERFRGYLARLRHGEMVEPPLNLLEDGACTVEIAADIQLDRGRFPNRLAIAKHLQEILSQLRPEEIDRNTGLWAWLSLFYFDEVCRIRPDGTRRPGQDYRHIPDFSYRYRHRHLLYGPYELYRRHGVISALLLSGLVNSESAIYHEIASRQDLIANRGVIEATLELYLDRKRMGPKQGSQDPKGSPGSIRRFVRVIQQFDVTYDVYGMSGKDICGLLPAEFDAWLNRGQRTLPV